MSEPRRRRRRPAASKPASVPAAFRLRWSKRAEADLDAIGDFIAADDPVAAAAWVEKLLERARKLALFPRAGRVVPEFRLEEPREVSVRTYRIVYRVRDAEVQILTVFEGHRRFQDVSDLDRRAR